MSIVQGLLNYWSECKDSQDFWNCLLYRGVSTAEGCPLSGVPLLYGIILTSS